MIKTKFDEQKILSLNLLATILYVFIIFVTFDTYCLNEVTPELVLMNVFGMPFARMELIGILFSLTFVIGVVISILLKNKSKNILSFSLALIGIITLLICILDVNLLQAIFPTLRISHVIMTLSRLSAFAVGATGLFVGFNLATIANYASKIDIKIVFYALAIAFVASILGIAENLFSELYCLVAVFALIIAIISQYTNKQLEIKMTNKFDIAIESNNLFITFGIVFTFITTNLFMFYRLKFEIYACLAVLLIMATLFFAAIKIKLPNIAKYVLWGVGVIATILNVFVHTDIIFICSVSLIAFDFGTLVRKEKFDTTNMAISSVGAILATIIAYVFNHKVSDVTIFSGNRVVYTIKSWFLFVILGIMCACILFNVIPRLLYKYKNCQK